MSRSLISSFSTLALLGAAASGIHFSQTRLSSDYRELGRGSEVYAMPSEEQLIVFSLGYRSALGDLLYGRTLVAAGIHFVEHREFKNLDAYLRGIIALDPDFLQVYLYSDALLNLSTVELPKENLRTARDIIEQGLQRFPDSAELWMSAGLFMAFSAPQRLPENEDVAEWRAAGAKAVQQSCQLWPDPGDLPPVCISSLFMLRQTGEAEAEIAALERLIAVTDDLKVRGQAMAKLSQLTGVRAASVRQHSLERLSQLHAIDMPGLTRTGYQLVGPPSDAYACAGARELNSECATNFLDWGGAGTGGLFLD